VVGRAFYRGQKCRNDVQQLTCIGVSENRTHWLNLACVGENEQIIHISDITIMIGLNSMGLGK
jgi:hypothetical protein